MNYLTIEIRSRTNKHPFLFTYAIAVFIIIIITLLSIFFVNPISEIDSVFTAGVKKPRKVL